MVVAQSWRASALRQAKNDPDLKAALLGGAVSAPVGVLAVAIFSVWSLHYFSMIGLCLMASLIVARRRSFNPLIALQSTLLGCVFGSAAFVVLFGSSEYSRIFALYLCTLSFFHYGEFIITAVTNRRGLQADSFLLNHSYAYWGAMIAGWTEFVLEGYLTPSLKMAGLSLFGFVLCVVGELIRKSAMLCAGSGFTHRLAVTKRPDHRLCTNGIYGFARHPGYLGWFIWSISTQLVLCNPICFLAYAIVSWKFFNDRIADEERDLVTFFGSQYVEYQQKVWVGVPFVVGYVPPAQ